LAKEIAMERRSFLKTAAAVLPAAGLGRFALGQAGAAALESGIHPVGAGQDRLGETHSLGFSTILFKVLPRETGDGLFVIEHQGLGHGEAVLGPRGVPHGFVGVGEKPAHLIIAFTPAGLMEGFFREAAVPNGPAMDAPLFAKYDMRYVGPPLVAG
jgi:hypothetical protein